MSTEATPVVAPAGNLSMAQLAANLSKPVSGSPQPLPSVAEPKPGTPASEPKAPDGEPGATPPDLLNKPPAGEPEGEPTVENPEPESAEPGEVEHEVTEGTEPAGEPEPTEPQGDELPAELKEAIEIAKTQGAKGVADLLKRVHKLTGEKKSAQQAEQAAKAEVERVKAERTESPAPVTPVGEHPDMVKLNNEVGVTDQMLEWCETNPDGGELPDGKGGKRTLDASAVRMLQKRANDYRTELVAERSQMKQHIAADFQQKQTQAHALAVREYPWLNKPESSERKSYEEMLKAIPQLKSFPDHELVVADYIRGYNARVAAAKARGAKPAVKRPEPTKVVTAPPAAAPAAKPKVQKEQEEAEGKFGKTGKTDDLAALFAAKRKAR